MPTSLEILGFHEFHELVDDGICFCSYIGFGLELSHTQEPKVGVDIVFLNGEVAKSFLGFGDKFTLRLQRVAPFFCAPLEHRLLMAFV